MVVMRTGCVTLTLLGDGLELPEGVAQVVCNVVAAQLRAEHVLITGALHNHCALNNKCVLSA
jgi:hypothetical protein